MLSLLIPFPSRLSSTTPLSCQTEPCNLPLPKAARACRPSSFRRPPTLAIPTPGCRSAPSCPPLTPSLSLISTLLYIQCASTGWLPLDLGAEVVRHGNLDPRRRGVAPIIRAFNGDTVNTAVPPTRALRPQAQSQLPCDLPIRSAAHQLAFEHHAERRRFERSLTRDANRIPDDFF